MHPPGYTTLRHLAGAADTYGARVDVHKLYTVLREAKKIPTLRTRMIVAMMCLVCSDQLS